jgi:hypothetical protein
VFDRSLSADTSAYCTFYFLRLSAPCPCRAHNAKIAEFEATEPLSPTLALASVLGDPPEIVRLAVLHVIDAELREGLAVAAPQELDHQLVLAARLRQPFRVGEIFFARIGSVMFM